MVEPVFGVKAVLTERARGGRGQIGVGHTGAERQKNERFESVGEGSILSHQDLSKST